MAKKFPDLTGDGDVTKADILKGRGVEGFKSGKFIQAAIKKPGALREQLGIKGKSRFLRRCLIKLLRLRANLGKGLGLLKRSEG